jgi:hypothetical protein
MNHLRRVVFGLFVLLVLGCQTQSKETTMILPDRDDESTAHGSAYTADSMHFRKPMPSHPDWRPAEFYFKECTQIGEKVYYSKTSYECSSR